MRTGDICRYSLGGVLAAILAIFLVWPIALTVRGAFISPDGQGTLYYLTSIFRDPTLVAGLWNSLRIAVCTTAVAFLIALPLAVLSARYKFPGKGLLSGMVLVPLILPPFVGAIGVLALLGRFGAVNALLGKLGLIDSQLPGVDFLGAGFVGVVVMEALHLFPIAYLNFAAALANVDPTLDEAALNLGAGWWRRFYRITLPLITPGLFAGLVIVFIWSFTELGTPLMFGYRQVTAVQIFEGLRDVQTNPRPFALVVVMLAVAGGLYLLSRAVLGGRGYAMTGKASIAGGEKPLVGLKGWVAAGVFVGVTLLAALPHIGVAIASFSVDGAWYRSILPLEWTVDHYAAALGHPLAVGAIRLSLGLSAMAMVLCLLVGFAIAYLSVRAKVRGAWLLDALAMLPLAVPGLVMAFGYVAMTLAWPFGSGQPLEGKLAVLGMAPNPLPLLVISYAVRRLPYVVRSAAAGLQQTSETLEEAALNLGAGTLLTLRRIVVPLVAANLIAGGILAFSFSMLEVSDSLVLAQKQAHFPVTRAIYEFFSRLGDGPSIAGAMGVWGMLLLTLTLISASRLLGRRMGAVFRV
ncbi:MAG: iron ABC transporter permease [Phycisphaeraceae bacterium]|nr:iron ABC transporter permease [Phycisphaeraceae bacterium]